MGEWALLLPALHEHRDRRPNTLIDEHHENLVLVAKKDRNRCLLRPPRTCTPTKGLLKKDGEGIKKISKSPPRSRARNRAQS